MRQDSRAQKPGVDLTFPDGKTGKIWGSSGIDDLRGTSFQKASVALKERAEHDDAFEWIIVIDLDQVVSAAFKSLLGMMTTLDQLVASKPDRRKITVQWKVQPGDDSMRSMASDTKRQIERRRRGSPDSSGLVIDIIEKEKSKRTR
ncbi:hypothetical protein QIH77_02300 [Bradyrhizobium diazoefficiens]|uniref:hypothetical protein n=1 Tax=Bradyrhizobium diazoefficiens TaxID=1355477 RepID=UPI00272C8D62|nr:hypothetical protein [Bradyrhizobium diazoefficiens]WLA74090.1 hypothetical protein QIH77_02300 [Bradyrhizobium diazoefficiens]